MGRRAPYSIQHTPYTIHHTAYSIQHTAYSIQHTAYNLQHTAYSLQPTAAYSLQPTAYSIQHTAYSIQHTAYSLQHTAISPCTISPSPCTMHHALVLSGAPVPIAIARRASWCHLGHLCLTGSQSRSHGGPSNVSGSPVFNSVLPICVCAIFCWFPRTSPRPAHTFDTRREALPNG